MIVDGEHAARCSRALDADRAPRAARGGARARRDPRRPGSAARRDARRTSPGSRRDMRAAVEKGVPMHRALAALPPADSTRPVSLELAPAAERGAGVSGGGAGATWDWTIRPVRRRAVPARLGRRPRPLAWRAARRRGTAGRRRQPPARRRRCPASSPPIARRLAAAGAGESVIDVRTDIFTYLAGHLPGAVFLQPRDAAGREGGIPTRLLPPDCVRTAVPPAGHRGSTGRW